MFACFELVDVEEQQIDALLSLVDDDQCDDRNPNDPSDNRSLEEIILEELREAKENRTPNLQCCNETPNLLKLLIVEWAFKVELSEDE